jgi:regulatory subunit for Cdc7p protein kinase
MSNMPIMTVQAMPARRAPLSSNPNAANSPLRGSASRTKRSYANLKREEPYGQPPPLKKQMLEIGSHRAVRDPNAASASASRARPATQVHRARPKPVAASVEVSKQQTAQEKELLMNWQKQYKARFPRMVFYFDSVSDDVRARLVKQIVYLGAVS